MRKRFQLSVLVGGIVLTSFCAQAFANLNMNSQSVTFVNTATAVDLENFDQNYVCTFTIDITGGVKRTYRGEGQTLSDAQWQARSACLADFDAGICLMGAYDCSRNN